MTIRREKGGGKFCDKQDQDVDANEEQDEEKSHGENNI